MALDRPDLSFASKEVARGMAKPLQGDVVNLKRAIRYLRAVPEFKIKFPFQSKPVKLTGYSDSDWAGCVRTRRSTSGGCILHGCHLIHHFSSTQANVALSSAEAELNAAVKIITECCGIRNFGKEMGLDFSVDIKIDSSAAQGILTRRGAGKIKHLEAKQLWVQELITEKKVSSFKIPRAENPSDCFTHYWSAADSLNHFPKMNICA